MAAPLPATLADLFPPINPANEAALAALGMHSKQGSDAPAPAVILRFMPVGNTPVLKQNVFRLAAASPFEVVVRNLRKKLGLKAQDPLFTYINFAFAPAPDEVLGNLYNSFGTQMGGTRQLVVHYSSTPAWG
ncbi:ubiquitin-like autophagy protein Apg12-domain-containing protein [Mycena rosella]|uniref:Ubiquitin-like protein ATG12 n=1 Tax=Mycena rosella TaxID=1033263 RepID=A0AAD7DDB8_MYCRO|nr:ubiquitin-like autophagy protein Apg12-domain-containing protein [Mycena rosella]